MKTVRIIIISVLTIYGQSIMADRKSAVNALSSLQRAQLQQQVTQEAEWQQIVNEAAKAETVEAIKAAIKTAGQRSVAGEQKQATFMYGIYGYYASKRAKQAISEADKEAFTRLFGLAKMNVDVKDADSLLKAAKKIIAPATVQIPELREEKKVVQPKQEREESYEEMMAGLGKLMEKQKAEDATKEATAIKLRPQVIEALNKHKQKVEQYLADYENKVNAVMAQKVTNDENKRQKIEDLFEIDTELDTLIQGFTSLLSKSGMWFGTDIYQELDEEIDDLKKDYEAKRTKKYKDFILPRSNEVEAQQINK